MLRIEDDFTLEDIFHICGIVYSVLEPMFRISKTISSLNKISVSINQPCVPIKMSFSVVY
jgi:hypothetical protein